MTIVYTDAGYKKLGEPPIFLGMVVEIDGEAITNYKIIQKPALSSTYAEYFALIWAQIYCLKIGELECQFLSDNQTMVRQIQGRYAVHKEELKALHRLAVALSKKFIKFSISHIKGKLNKADAIVKAIK